MNLARPASIAAILCWLTWGWGTAFGWSQENPLRDFEPSYLQRVLPNLQNYQSSNEQFSSELRTSTERWLDSTQVGTETRMPDGDPRPSPDDADVQTTESVGTNALLTSDLAQSLMAQETSSMQPSAGTRRESERKPFAGVESLQLSATMQKIILNTILVIAGAITLLLVLKKGWSNPKTKTASPASPLKVEQTIGLGGKSVLKVVRCGLNQVLVAIDGSGIKSVVALEPSINLDDEVLRAPPEPKSQHPIKEPVNIEQFVKLIKEMESDILVDRRHPGERLRPSRT